MGTPHRNFRNYNSPYTRPVQHQQPYPPHVDDFITLNTPTPMPTPNRPKRIPFQQHRATGSCRYSSTPIKEQTEDENDLARSSTGSGRNIPHFYQNHAQPHQHQHHNFRARSFGGGANYRGMWNNSRNNGNRRPHFQQQQRHGEGTADGDTFAMFFHPSMLEDPWKELMDRHNVLNSSATDQSSSKATEDNESSSSESEANSYFDDTDEDDDGGVEKVKHNDGAEKKKDEKSAESESD